MRYSRSFCNHSSFKETGTSDAPEQQMTWTTDNTPYTAHSARRLFLKRRLLTLGIWVSLTLSLAVWALTDSLTHCWLFFAGIIIAQRKSASDPHQLQT